MNTLQKIGKIVLWILFWYYLIPYYLLKKYVFSKTKHQVLYACLGSLVLVFAFFSWIGSGDDDSTTNTAKPKVHYVEKKVGQKELAQAKAKQKVLAKEKKKEQAEYEKLEAALSSAKAKVKKKKQAEKKAQEEAAKQRRSAEKEARRQAKAQAKRNNENQNSSHRHHVTGAPAGNHGDMNTADSGKIVGNVNSKIYHVPGQAGYRMNSSNAVYFNSEAEAQAAGYRKALR
ncbi:MULTISPECIES: hypothetical protein [Lactobacillus]|uniref:sunset domain-containing protein n=1 Tax=Lactobacillus TaxID=1578 RepID=UPI000CD8611B|nr:MULTISPECIES: hypothetical protein [Lactobacillus]RVU73121.1 hypothetical protein EJK20_09530 [Lactobacillus xujianguonis]